MAGQIRYNHHYKQIAHYSLFYIHSYLDFFVFTSQSGKKKRKRKKKKHSPGDLRRLAVTQTPLKNHLLTLSEKL